MSGDEFARLQIKLLATVNLEQVQIHISPNPAFVVRDSIFFLKDLSAHDKHICEATVSPSESELFLGELTIMISFINKQSIARVIKHIVEIPLKAALTKSTPQKDGLFKVTLSVSRPIDIEVVFSGKKHKTRPRKFLSTIALPQI